MSTPSLEICGVTLELLGKGQPLEDIHSPWKKQADLLECLQAEHLKIFPQQLGACKSVSTRKMERIEAACYLPDDTDCPFTVEELRRCKHKGKDTAPGADGISYSMIANMGPGAEILFLGLINKMWDQRKRSVAWNDQDFQPIPKPKDPMNPIPIALLSVLGMTAEKMVLARAKWKVELHTNLYVYI